MGERRAMDALSRRGRPRARRGLDTVPVWVFVAIGMGVGLIAVVLTALTLHVGRP